MTSSRFYIVKYVLDRIGGSDNLKPNEQSTLFKLSHERVFLRSQHLEDVFVVLIVSSMRNEHEVGVCGGVHYKLCVMLRSYPQVSSPSSLAIPPPTSHLHISSPCAHLVDAKLHAQKSKRAQKGPCASHPFSKATDTSPLRILIVSRPGLMCLLADAEVPCMRPTLEDIDIIRE